jgi:hypothetical protein
MESGEKNVPFKSDFTSTAGAIHEKSSVVAMLFESHHCDAASSETM